MKGILSLLLLTSFIYITLSAKADEGSIVVSMKSVNITVPYNPARKYFTILIAVGTPKQIYNVQIDTSVATSWLPSAMCKNCQKATKFYNHKESTTASPTGDKVELDDENGDVEGFKVQDTIEVAGYKMKQYGFVEVSEMDDDFTDHYDGKLGLGFRGEIGHDYNFIEKLKFDGLIPKRIFSLNTLNATYGLFLIGDLPVQQYKFCNVTFTEDLDDDYRESWVCELTHVGIVDTTLDSNIELAKTYETKHGRVDFDSAYDYIGAPIRDLDIFNQTLFNKMKCYSYKTELYAEDEVVYLCDKTEINSNETVTFVLQGNGYTIPLNELFIESSTPNKMEFLVRFIDDDDAIWTFGYPFMKRFMIIFNMEDRHVGIHSTNASAIVDMEKEWMTYFQKEMEERNEARKKFWILLCGILVVILVLVIICLCIRGAKKRQLYENGPMIEQENYNPDKIY